MYIYIDKDEKPGVCTWTGVCAEWHVNAHVCMYVCTYMYIYIYIVSKYAWLCMCVLNIYICMHEYRHTYRHTHTHSAVNAHACSTLGVVQGLGQVTEHRNDMHAECQSCVSSSWRRRQDRAKGARRRRKCGSSSLDQHTKPQILNPKPWTWKCTH